MTQWCKRIGFFIIVTNLLFFAKSEALKAANNFKERMEKFMHFANKETIHGKAVRACSFVLAMLIMCSMMFVGQVGSVKVDAFAKSDFIYAGKMMFIDVSEVSNWWFTDGGKLELQCWGGDGGDAVYTIATGAGSSNSDYWVAENTYCFVFPKEHDAFLVRRPTNSEGDYTNQTVNVTEQPLGCNCLVIKDANSNQSYQHGTRWKKQIDWKYFDDTRITRSIRTGTSDSRFLTAKQNFGAQVDGVTLFPISAQFYDYYTDYEIEYGWRSQKDNSADGAVSRSWMNSFPFNNLNKYISNKANGASWEYPLYFGNFFTYTGYNYMTSPQHPRFDGDNPSRDGGLVNRFNESSPIVKFSSQANNSMFLKNQGTTADKSDSTLQYSFASLVNSTLSNDNITMGTGAVTVPYFSDDLVNDGYATKVTSKFPMRVTDATTTDSQPYKKYSFNSKDGTDNIYFSNYGTDNFSINYSATKKVRDALSGFDNTGNGIGFFPFDNDNGTYGETDAYDFGFGVRWDMQFNLTKDGKISNSVDPITFSFSGDDDVWVFIDGQLALDLGGDHKWATGKIDFATKTSTVTTGVYKPNGNYSNPTSYYKSSSTDLNYTLQSGDTYVAQLNSGIFAESDFYSKPHTMTVFYMERGMSESNLSMEFTMSPLENQLLVDKTVDYNDVNAALKTVTKKYVDSDTFDYEVKVGDSSTATVANWTYSYGGATGGVPVYTDLNGANSTPLAANGTVTGIKNGEGFIFNKQINDNGSKYVDVKEIDTENLYTYSHHMSVKDVSNNSTDTDTDTDEVNFNFKTKSTKQGAVTNYEVHNVNTVQTGKVTLNKVYTGTANATKKFNFDVKIRVPGAQDSEIVTISCEVTAGTPTEITGIPIGSQVVVTENNVTSDEYTTSYVIETGNSTNGTTATITKLETDTTVTFTNEDVVPNVSATVEANKTLDGSASSTQFDFTLTKLNGGVKSTKAEDIKTEKNGTDGNISFNLSDLEANKTYNYLLEEVSQSNSIYNFDTKKYWVKVDTSSPVSVKYYETTVNDSTYTMGSAVNGVTFENTTKTASIIVKKTDSNNAAQNFIGTEFRIYEVTDKGAGLPTTAKEEKTIESSQNTVTFDGLTHGQWYAIVETKAIDGYELNGTIFYKQADATKDVNVDADATAITVPVQDNKSTNLPRTGGPGAIMLVIGGIVLVTLGVYLLKPTKKDKTNSK